MNNKQFLSVLKEAFLVYLKTHARSNEKLKILHGAIAKDLAKRLGESKYSIASLGFKEGKEEHIFGQYIDKAVDIVVSQNGSTIAGIAVKFVMSNYAQNANNYFESMLGETANIRCAKIPYFQVLILPDEMPYFDKNGNITHWEVLSTERLNKYALLSQDNADLFLHAPNKTLLYVINIQKAGQISTASEYKQHYLKSDFSIRASPLTLKFGSGVIYNNYELFSTKVVHTIKSV